MEKETKKSKLTTLLIVVLIILLIAVSVFGGWAWSKYTSSEYGNATATVAKWNFGTTTSIRDLDLAKAGGAVIFDTVNNVATDRIAPGTKGSFKVALDTSGTEVALKYDIVLSNIKNKPTNLHFYSDEGLTKKIDSTDGLSATYSGYIAQDDHGTSHEVTIYWQWKYVTGTSDEEIATNDDLDTKDGEAATANGVTFDLTITGTQVNPGETQVTTD